MSTPTDALARLGITLPAPAAPVASYVGYVVVGKLVYVSGQVPLVDGKIAVSGLLGRDVSVEQGMEAARICAINLLAQAQAAAGGSLEGIGRVVRLGGFVASTPDFTDHPKVVNGASDLMKEVFGEAGAHARAAVGVAALPLNSAVEVEGLFELA
ncbi:MAG: RidA family protein [Pseudomonadota bacterium]